MNNPRPVPTIDFVANFVNNLGRISVSIPWPASLTLISICLAVLSLLTSTDISSPSFVNLIALLNRLEITWVTLSLSAFTIMSSLLRHNNLIWPRFFYGLQEHSLLHFLS